jgi:hypothetical protein
LINYIDRFGLAELHQFDLDRAISASADDGVRQNFCP